MKRFAAFATLLFLAGCAGGSTTYLQLAPVTPDHHLTVKGAALAVDHVQLPATIDRLYLTAATGRDTLSVAGHARWVAPLDGMATRVLATDLAERIDGIRVVMPGDPTPAKGARHVRVNVTRFLPIRGGPDAGHVVLDADWQLLGPNGTVLHAQRSRIRVAAGGTPAQEAGAMSAALGRLADRIAGALATH